MKDFVDDLRGKHVTYGFRNVGRRPNSARLHSSGEVLLPGAYEHRDFIDIDGKKSMTYNFRSTDRNSGPKIGHGYGDKACMHACVHICVLNFAHAALLRSLYRAHSVSTLESLFLFLFMFMCRSWILAQHGSIWGWEMPIWKKRKRIWSDLLLRNCTYNLLKLLLCLFRDNNFRSRVVRSLGSNHQFPIVSAYGDFGGSSVR